MKHLLLALISVTCSWAALQAADDPPIPLWDETQALPIAEDIPSLDGVKFRGIKQWDQKSDGSTIPDPQRKSRFRSIPAIV